MARKKAQVAARKQQGEIEPHSPTAENPKRPPSPPAEDQFGHLKALNSLLLKETMERREQVSHLNSLLGDLSADHSFLSSLEGDVTRLVLSSRLADEQAAAEGRAKSLQAAADSALRALESSAGEKEEIKKSLDLALLDRDLKKNQMEDLEAKLREVEASKADFQNALEREGIASLEYRKKLQDLEAKMEEVVRRKEVEVESLMAEREADAAKKVALEEELRCIVLAKEQLEGELGEAKYSFFSLKKEEDALQSKVVDLEERNEKVVEELYKKLALEEEHRCLVLAKEQLEGELGEAKDAFFLLKKEDDALQWKVVNLEERNKKAEEELDRLRGQLDAMKKEKEVGEERFGAKLVEYSKIETDLLTRIVDISMQNEEIMQERARQDNKISRLQEKVEQVQYSILDLERMLKDQSVVNVLLQAERDAAQMDLAIQRGEAEALRLSLGEIEKNRASIEQELERLSGEFSQLQKTKEEGEKTFELQLRESAEQLDDLRVKLGEVVAEMDRIEQARTELEAEITRLQKLSEHQDSTILDLKRECSDHVVSSVQLRTDRDATQRDLDSEREAADRLKVQLIELEKSKEEMMDKFEIFKAEHAGLAREDEVKTERISSLIAEKASLERSLTSAHTEIKGVAAKMKASEMNFEKTLSRLKSISVAVHDMGDGQENGITRDIGEAFADTEVGEEMQPFVADLESIRKAFIYRVGKCEDLNQEVKMLKGAVADAQNNKGGLWTRFAPAVSAFSLAVASIAAAYAAKSFLSKSGKKRMV